MNINRQTRKTKQPKKAPNKQKTTPQKTKLQNSNVFFCRLLAESLIFLKQILGVFSSFWWMLWHPHHGQSPCGAWMVKVFAFADFAVDLHPFGHWRCVTGLEMPGLCCAWGYAAVAEGGKHHVALV